MGIEKDLPSACLHYGILCALVSIIGWNNAIAAASQSQSIQCQFSTNKIFCTNWFQLFSFDYYLFIFLTSWFFALSPFPTALFLIFPFYLYAKVNTFPNSFGQLYRIIMNSSIFLILMCCSGSKNPESTTAHTQHKKIKNRNNISLDSTFNFDIPRTESRSDLYV